VEENDAEVMHELAAADLAVRIPDRHLEGIIVDRSASLVQHRMPRDAFRGRRCDIVYGNPVTQPAASAHKLTFGQSYFATDGQSFSQSVCQCQSVGQSLSLGVEPIRDL